MASPSASAGERTCALTLRASLAQWRHPPEVSVVLAARALAALEVTQASEIPVVLNLTDPQSLETVATISGGRAHFLCGRFEDAREWLERGLVSDGAGYSVWRISGLGSLGLLEAWSGRLDRAEELADSALALAHEAGMSAHPSTADAHLARAIARLERGEPGLAAPSLHDGALQARRNRRWQLLWISRLVLAMLQAANDEPDEAMKTLLASEGDMGLAPPIVAERMQALRARLLRLGGSAEQAHRVLAGARPDSLSLLFEEAAVALTLGEPHLARKVLSASLAVSSPAEPLDVVERCLLSAWVSDAEGATGDAADIVSEAISVAERYSLVEVFVRAGPAVVRLVSRLSDHRSPFRGAILDRAGEALSRSLGGGLVEPLTNRELGVLTYLPSRLTNAELAERCYVSVNTVKTHVARIYRKLGVANRDEAISRARELGLL